MVVSLPKRLQSVNESGAEKCVAVFKCVWFFTWPLPSQWVLVLCSTLNAHGRREGGGPKRDKDAHLRILCDLGMEGCYYIHE